MDNNEIKKRSEALREERELLENASEESLQKETSSYTYRHLDREAPEEQEVSKPLTFTNPKDNNDPQDDYRLKYKRVDRTRHVVLMGIVCLILIIGVSLLLYFFVFRTLSQ